MYHIHFEFTVVLYLAPGQDGVSHVNNKPLSAVVEQLRIRGFELNKEAGAPLRDGAVSSWIKRNVHVYYRAKHSSVVEDDA